MIILLKDQLPWEHLAVLALLGVILLLIVFIICLLIAGISIVKIIMHYIQHKDNLKDAEIIRGSVNKKGKQK